MSEDEKYLSAETLARLRQIQFDDEETDEEIDEEIDEDEEEGEDLYEDDDDEELA